MVAVRVAFPDMSEERGDRIARRREQLGLSQSELARRVGLSAAYINQLESGARKGSIDALSRIAAELQVSLAALEGDEALPARSSGPRIPVAGEVARGGVVKSDLVRSVVVPGVAARRGAIRDDESIEAPIGVDPARGFAIPIGAGMESEGLSEGSLLVCDPKRQPQPNQLVLAVDEDGARVRLMRYRVIDGEPTLWPMPGSTEHPVRLSVGDWRVVAVASGVWRPF